MIGVFYFLVLRPMKREDERKRLSGSSVATTSC
jgi:preprotein translocase subunit YajC